MKKYLLAVCTIVALATVSYAELYPAKRFVEFGTNIDVTASENLMPLDEVFQKDLVIDFEYDEKIVSPKILRYEVLAFMEVDYPSLICFNLHETEAKKYKIVVKDVCCEYCFMDMIEELFTMKGIVSVKSDYDEINHHYNINLYIEYNPNLLKVEDLKRIEENLNN